MYSNNPSHQLSYHHYWKYGYLPSCSNSKMSTCLCSLLCPSLYTLCAYVCFSPFPDDLEFVTQFCRMVNVSCSVWTLQLRDFPQPLMEWRDKHMFGRLVAAEQRGTDRGGLYYSHTYTTHTPILLTNLYCSQH